VLHAPFHYAAFRRCNNSTDASILNDTSLKWFIAKKNIAQPQPVQKSLWSEFVGTTNNIQHHDHVQVCHEEMTLAEAQHVLQDASTMSNVPTHMWPQGRFTEQANGPTGKDIVLIGDLFKKKHEG
jgi:hypothetical protein